MKIVIVLGLLAYVCYGQQCSSTNEADCLVEVVVGGVGCCSWVALEGQSDCRYQSLGCPTSEPTPDPSPDPTAPPTSDPSPRPTVDPSSAPSPGPSPSPTVDPTMPPTSDPSPGPSTVNPTSTPSSSPSTTTTTTTTTLSPTSTTTTTTTTTSTSTLTPTSPPTPCICTYSPTAKPTEGDSKSKGKSGEGLGCGDCDCDGGVKSLSFQYTGTQTNVQLELFYDKSWGDRICLFTGINPGDEVTCEISSYSGDAEKFPTETTFTLTYSNGKTCKDQYHTSCSSDIVGTLPKNGVCTKLLCTGWSDRSNNECGTCERECVCDSDTTLPPFIVTKTPDFCFCEDTECPTRRRMKGKKSSSSDTDTDDIGGICDCDCDKDVGMQMMTLRNENSYPISIVYSGSSKGGKGKSSSSSGSTMCSDSGITQGGESTCDISSSSAFSKFPTNTDLIVTNDLTGTECAESIHTSCSSDIIGASVCGMRVVRWADDNLCKSPIQQCSCNGTYIPEFPDPTEVPIVEVTKDVCYCSTRSDGYTSISQLSLIASTRRRMKGKSSSKSQLGVGECDCDKDPGMQVIRWKWMGGSIATTIAVYGDDSKSSSDLICRFSDVTIGEEIECKISASLGWDEESFGTNTYITVVAATASDSCSDAEIHTSCSSDIVGVAADNCDGLVCTGWADGDGYCDDGFTECICDEDENAFRLFSGAHTMQIKLALAVITAAVAYMF